MPHGIDHSKKVVEDLGKLVMDAIPIAKHGVGIGAISQLFTILADVKDLLAEAPQALPELKDMDSAKAGELSSVCYEMVRRVITSIVM